MCIRDRKKTYCHVVALGRGSGSARGIQSEGQQRMLRFQRASSAFPAEIVRSFLGPRNSRFELLRQLSSVFPQALPRRALSVGRNWPNSEPSHFSTQGAGGAEFRTAPRRFVLALLAIMVPAKRQVERQVGDRAVQVCGLDERYGCATSAEALGRVLQCFADSLWFAHQSRYISSCGAGASSRTLFCRFRASSA
eukprot:10688860-Alexandrium_andersonii.AAC.1